MKLFRIADGIWASAFLSPPSASFRRRFAKTPIAQSECPESGWTEVWSSGLLGPTQSSLNIPQTRRPQPQILALHSSATAFLVCLIEREYAF